MVLSIIVTKKQVTFIQTNLWLITLNFVLNDRITDVLNKDVSVKYRTGQAIAHINQEFINIIQKEVDNYKSEQFLLTHTQLNNRVILIQNNIVL